MDRKGFLQTVCRLGICGCVASVLGRSEADAAEQAEPPDQRLAFVRYQVANMVTFMAGAGAAPTCTGVLENTGRECSKLGGVAARFKGDPEGYFAAARKAWGTEFHWDKAKGLVTVTVGAGPCGCPLVDASRTPPFWCNCSVGYQAESFSTLVGRRVEASVVESKLAGGTRCVFRVAVGPTPA